MREWTNLARDTSAAWTDFRDLPAHQQPRWPDEGKLRSVLDGLPPRALVDERSVAILRQELADLGDGFILQIGDCVEDIETDVWDDTLSKLEFIQRARRRLAERTGRSVLAVGRIAGQYAKPRSNDFERVGDFDLPVYRGPIVNAPQGNLFARTPSPSRIARAHAAATTAHAAVSDYHGSLEADQRIWTSHEMLLLDYELQFLRRGQAVNHLGTTHWPWVGARTAQLDGAHVAVAASLHNPVGVKIGPDTTPDQAVRLARRLDPIGEPGRVTFIIRFGHGEIERLEPLARAVRDETAGVVWLSDPMHGNTVKAASGLKTRHLEHIVDEVAGFQKILRDLHLHPAGLHLEATAEPVFECASGGREPEDPARFRSLVDPRLNAEQLDRVLDAWTA